MHDGFGHHARGTRHGLHGEFGREITGQTHAHAAVGHRLDEKINVSGSTAAETGDGIKQRLLHMERLADRGENFLHSGDVFVRHAIAGGIGRGALLHEGGGVGHDAHHVALCSGRLLQRLDGDTGHDGDEQLAREIGCGFAQSGQGILRFDAEQDDIRCGRHFTVAARHADPALGAEHFRRLGKAVVHDHFGRFADFGRENTLDQGRAHFSATDETNFHKNKRKTARAPGKRKARAARKPQKSTPKKSPRMAALATAVVPSGCTMYCANGWTKDQPFNLKR